MLRNHARVGSLGGSGAIGLLDDEEEEKDEACCLTSAFACARTFWRNAFVNAGGTLGRGGCPRGWTTGGNEGRFGGFCHDGGPSEELLVAGGGGGAFLGGGPFATAVVAVIIMRRSAGVLGTPTLCSCNVGHKFSWRLAFLGGEDVACSRGVIPPGLAVDGSSIGGAEAIGPPVLALEDAGSTGGGWKSVSGIEGGGRAVSGGAGDAGFGGEGA